LGYKRVEYEDDNSLISETPIVETLKNCSDTEDALRLILIAACCSKTLTAAEKSSYLAYMQEHGIDPAPFHFILRLR